MDSISQLEAFARWYASLAWAVVPLHSPEGIGCSCGNPNCKAIGKHPRTISGLKDATIVADIIRDWWGRWANANIGIATGSISKMFALDVDPRHRGNEALAVLLQEHGLLPPTVQAITGSGGFHFYFAHPGFPVPNSSSKLGSGLDIKGENGYVVAPGSLHASGRFYSWAEGRRPDQIELSPAPLWLLDKLRQPKVSLPAVLTAERRDLVQQGATEGARNASVASLAGHLLRRNIDPYTVLDLLKAWNVSRNCPPLSDEEVARTINSIAGRELARRRGVRHD